MLQTPDDDTPGAMSEAPVSAHEALLQFLYCAPIGLVQGAADGTITLINPVAAQLLMPLSRDGSLDNLFELLASVAPRLRQMTAAAPASAGVVCQGLRIPLRRMSARPAVVLELSLRRLDAATLMASLHDVSSIVSQERERLSRSVQRAGELDSLTQLGNRGALLRRVSDALAKARQDPGFRCALLFINCDRFSRVNLMWGQVTGDAVLQQMAGRLNAVLRQHDAVARPRRCEPTASRLSGDEFVVVLEGVRHATDVHAVAQRLVDTLHQPYMADGRPVHVTTSIGVVCEREAQDAEALLDDASLAMREAKRAGGGRWCLFEPAMMNRARQRGSLEADLRQAIAGGELFVVYQPIVALTDDGRVLGMEALVRWRHPERGPVMPIDFIGVAEETGLIADIGQFVLHQACCQLTTWQQQLGPLAPLTMSVNLSRAQLLDDALQAVVRRTLADSGLPAHCLQLEVTESLAAQDAQVCSRLQGLKTCGLSVALDDFGTGYSALASLVDLPIDVLKIDRSFVSQIDTSAHHRVLVEATVMVARSLGLGTVAEGVETAAQAAVLRELHCDKAQGYFYAKPMDADTAGRWLAAQRGFSPARALPAPESAQRGRRQSRADRCSVRLR